MPTPTVAANAYSALAKLAPTSSAGGGASKPGGTSFGSLLESMLSNFAQKGHDVDAKTVALAAGKADLVDVVTAVSESEVAVETLVSVRDKVISAYEEIMRMPI
jgi:flagellar hook-basal body complex protein FliE